MYRYRRTCPVPGHQLSTNLAGMRIAKVTTIQCGKVASRCVGAVYTVEKGGIEGSSPILYIYLRRSKEWKGRDESWDEKATHFQGKKLKY